MVKFYVTNITKKKQQNKRSKRKKDELCSGIENNQNMQNITRSILRLIIFEIYNI